MSNSKNRGHEQPVSDEIHRAAERAGIESSESAADADDWADSERIRNLPLTITLAEACNLVGRDLDANRFNEQVFDVIAREIDTLSDLAETSEAGFEGWAAFQNLCDRIRLAGRIAEVIGGAP